MDGIDVSKKILAISLVGRSKVVAKAAFDGERLMFSELEEIKGAFGSWKSKMVDRIQAAKEHGYIVFVEEKGSVISQHADRLDLTEVGEDGRVKMASALDLYYAATNMGTLYLPEKLMRHHISSEIADKDVDDQGRTKYRLNAQEINGYHRAILLVVMAAYVTPGLSLAYLEQVFDARRAMEQHDIPDHLRGLVACTSMLDHMIGNKGS